MVVRGNLSSARRPAWHSPPMRDRFSPSRDFGSFAMTTLSTTLFRWGHHCETALGRRRSKQSPFGHDRGVRSPRVPDARQPPSRVRQSRHLLPPSRSRTRQQHLDGLLAMTAAGASLSRQDRSRTCGVSTIMNSSGQPRYFSARGARATRSFSTVCSDRACTRRPALRAPIT